MKKLIFSLVLLITISCYQKPKNSIIDEEYKNQDSTLIEKLIPEDIIYNEGLYLSSDEKKEIDFFQYIISQGYVTGLLEPDMEKMQIHEQIYNSILFYNNNDNLIILESFSQNDDNKSSSNEKQNELIKKYSFNSQGMLISVVNPDSDIFSTRYYHTNNNLSKIIINTLKIFLTHVKKHEIQHTPTKKCIKTIKYEYSGNKLIAEINESEYELMKSHISNNKTKKLFYRSSLNHTPRSFIKEVGDHNTMIYGLNNEKLKFIAEYINGVGFKGKKYPFRIFVFDYNYNKNKYLITSYLKGSVNSKTVYYVADKYTIERTNDYKLARLIRSEKIINKKSEQTYDYYYEYHYSLNELLGYNIFFAEYESDPKKPQSLTVEYRLEKYFHKIK